jgi:hypothetical protein
MKKALILSLITTAIFFHPSPVLAKKKISRSNKSKPNSHSQDTNTPWTKLKLRVDRNALTLAMGDLDLANQLDYSLTYQSGEVVQGISGSLDLERTSQQKEFLFGTCSGTNCTYHQDIKDMILEIIIKLNSNQTLTRRYQINP